MKNWLLSALAAAALASPLAASAAPIQVTVNGQPVPFDQPPVEVGGRVLVPVRGVFQGLGATVTWNPGTRTVTAIRNQDIVVLPLGSPIAQVDGQNRQLDQPAQILGGRTLVPLRFISEALGAQVQWIPAESLVAVNSVYQNTPPASMSNDSYEDYGYHYPLVQSVRSDTPGPVWAGHVMHVTLNGDPGGSAAFTVAGHAPLPMTEVSPGQYQGTYTVQYNDNNPAAYVVGTLQMPDGEIQSLEDYNPVSIYGFSPRPIRYWGEGPSAFRAVNVASGTLWVGDVLRLTFEAAPGGSGFFMLGGARIPVIEQSPGVYVGMYTAPPNVVGTLPVMASFQAPGQPAQEVLVRQPVCVMGNLVPRGRWIGNLTTVPPTQPGHPVLVQMTAAPGAHATFNVGAQEHIPMREISPGHYEGQFTPRPGQTVSNAEVTAQVATPQGGNATLAAPRRLTMMAPSPPHGAPQPVLHPAQPAQPALHPQPGQAAPRPQSPPRPGHPAVELRDVSTNHGPFHRGDTITVTAHGTPHSAATASMPGARVQLHESAPGTYTGTLRLPPTGPHPGSVHVELRQSGQARHADTPVTVQEPHRPAHPAPHGSPPHKPEHPEH